MAVYTQLEFDEIAALVAPLARGRLIHAEGVTAGVENTTYFLDFETPTGNRRYVLTIAETLSHADLQFIATLTYNLSTSGLPVPAPVFDGNRFSAERAVLSIRGKPALLVPHVHGTHPEVITPELCHHVGQTLARLHVATRAMSLHHESHRSLHWVERTANALLPHLNEDDRALLITEIESLRTFVSTNNEIPQAIIHGDLFRDNVLIEHGQISALIDFFSAGTSYLLLDLAITVNDWCFDESGNLNRLSYEAIIGGYCSVRPLEAAESEHWGEMLRIAALRFWVSRLNERHMADLHAPRGRGKDPSPYRRLLLLHRDSPMHLPLPG